jgi:hypothetical protein
VLALRGLLGKTRRVFWICAAVGVAAHLSLTRIAGFEAEEKAAKPLTTQFVKRQPRLTKPLELKKRPQPKRRQVQRKMVAVKARMQHAQGGVRFQPLQVLGGLARPAVQVGRAAGFAGTEFEPTSFAGAIEGTREAEQKIDMSLELMDIEALDTGRYHAMVVQDPGDKRSIKGFCRLSVIYSPQFFPVQPFHPIYSFEQMVDIGFHRLVTAMNDFTDIKTEAMGRMNLNDKALFKAPWVLFSPTMVFQLSHSQRRTLGEYLLAGGFMFADGQDYPLTPGWTAAFRSLRIALIGSLKECRVIASVEKLPSSHPIYHCYFDFDGPSGACDTLHKHQYPSQVPVVGYGEGIEVEGRLLAFVTGKGFAQAWSIFGPSPGSAPNFDPKPGFRFGTNTVVFALTQEGSITHRLMSTLE